MQPLTFAYDTQVHRSAETTWFDLVLMRPLSGIILPGTVLQDGDPSRGPADPSAVQVRHATQASRRAQPCSDEINRIVKAVYGRF